MESSFPRSYYDIARLYSPFYQHLEHTQVACFQFYYHMYGASIGTLRIFIKEEDQNTPLEPSWEATGNQGEQWLIGQIEIRPENVFFLKPFQIIIEGVVGLGHQGDIAIDDLSLVLGKSCTNISSNGTVEIINDSMAIDLDDNGQWSDNATDNNNNNGTYDGEFKLITPGIFRSIVDMNQNKTHLIHLNNKNISLPITTTTTTTTTSTSLLSKSTINSEDKNPTTTTTTTSTTTSSPVTTMENLRPDTNNSINEQPEKDLINKNNQTELDNEQSIANKSASITDKHSLAIVENNEEIGHSLPLASAGTKNINDGNKNHIVGKYESSHWSFILSLIGLLVILSALIYFLYTNWPLIPNQNDFKAIFTGSRCNFFHLNTGSQRQQDDDSEMLVTQNNLHNELSINDDNGVYDNDVIRIH